MARRPPTPERVFYHLPPENIFRPPDFPPRADPWNEVHNPYGDLVDPLKREEENGNAQSHADDVDDRNPERSWSAYPTPSDLALAFRLWSLPDSVLQLETSANETDKRGSPKKPTKGLPGGARTRPARRRELGRDEGQRQRQGQSQEQEQEAASPAPGGHTVDELLEEEGRRWDEEQRQQEKRRERIQREKPPRPDDYDKEVDGVNEVLGTNVYEHLLQNWLLPLADEDFREDAQMKRLDGPEVGKVGWTWDEIFSNAPPPPPQEQQQHDGPEHRQEHSAGADVGEENTERESVKLNNHDILTDKYWTIKRLKQELSKRKKDISGKSMDLRCRLYALVKTDGNKEKTKKDKVCLLPKTDLSHWGIQRREECVIEFSPNARLSPLDMYTWAIQLSPYNLTYWISRAYLFYQMGHFDLALGDTHRALLLCEVLYDSRCRTRQPGLYPRIWHSIEGHISQLEKEAEGRHISKMRDPNGINYFIPTLRRLIHHITSLSLLKLECWDDYKAMEAYLPQRLLMAWHFKSPFEKRLAAHSNMIEGPRGSKLADRMFFEDRYGKVSGKRYPFRANDVDRTSKPFLEYLNAELITDNSRLPWKRCEIQAMKDDPGHLGVFATTDIRRGEIIYVDEPSMKGCLYLHRPIDARNRKDPIPDRCEHCRRKLPRRNKTTIAQETVRDRCPCTLKEDQMLRFCPAPSNSEKSCLEIAKASYHFRTCGGTWKWLYEAMRPVWNTWRNADEKEPRHYYTHNNEMHGTTLSLLLREVFDTTLLRRVRSKNPNLLAHELDELLPLEGDSQWGDNYFPFSLAANIRVPFDILMNLGVDIFKDLTFDTWVIQLVLRKLLLAAVPWDHSRRHHKVTVENFNEKILPKREVQTKSLDLPSFIPTLKDLGLYPGLAMFNHKCAQWSGSNAWWGYDNVLPNRVVVWASRSIPKGQEITIPYSSYPFDSARSTRTLGRPCNCGFPHPEKFTKPGGKSEQGAIQSFDTEPSTSFEVHDSQVMNDQEPPIPPCGQSEMVPDQRTRRPCLPSEQKRSREQENDPVEEVQQTPSKKSRTRTPQSRSPPKSRDYGQERDS